VTVLADTSVWIDHLRASNSAFRTLLLEGAVAIHPFVVGEVACGNLKNRAAVLGSLRALPQVVVATDEEVLELLERRKLWGQGIGWVDAHLLASTLLSGCDLWTGDERLNRAARLVGAGRFR
jgi:predicted nucleic acid-binding protein